jgi:hypothetical protein
MLKSDGRWALIEHTTGNGVALPPEQLSVTVYNDPLAILYNKKRTQHLSSRAAL